MIKQFCLVTFLLPLVWSVQIHAKESQSIDPTGEHFLQRSTGDTFNCGPLTALIARKYADNEFDPRNLNVEISQARGLVNTFMKKTNNADRMSWWNLRDIQVYLKFMGVGVERHKLARGRNPANQLKEMIEKKKLVIINVNMNDLPYGKQTGKPYSTFYLPGGWGHYLAIVGFEKRNNETYFNTHDSFSPKGKNRLYSAKQIVRAMRRFAPVYLEVKQGV